MRRSHLFLFDRILDPFAKFRDLFTNFVSLIVGSVCWGILSGMITIIIAWPACSSLLLLQTGEIIWIIATFTLFTEIGAILLLLFALFRFPRGFKFFPESGSLRSKAQFKGFESVLFLFEVFFLLLLFSSLVPPALSLLLFHDLLLYLPGWSGLTIFKKTDFLIHRLLLLHIVIELKLYPLTNLICRISRNLARTWLTTRLLLPCSGTRPASTSRTIRHGAHFLCGSLFILFNLLFAHLPVLVGWGSADHFLLFALAWSRWWPFHLLTMLRGWMEYYGWFSTLLPFALGVSSSCKSCRLI